MKNAKQKLEKVIRSSKDLMNNIKKANDALDDVLNTLGCASALISTLIKEMYPDVQSFERVSALLKSGLEFETIEDDGNILIRIYNDKNRGFSEFYDLYAWVRYETDFN